MDSVLQVQATFFLYLLIQSRFQNATAQSCPQSENGGLPSFANYGGGNSVDRITLEHQAIIPSYRFVCNQMCGNITEWGVDVEPGGGGDDGEYTLVFQVWRSSPTVDVSSGTGCYSLVGSNRFSQISLSDSVAKVTPSPQDYIMFRPGDVVGFYVEEARVGNGRGRGNNDGRGVVVLTSPSSFTSEIVWYTSIALSMATSQNGDCPYSVGSGGVLNTLTQAAPVISISASTFSCPPLPTPPPQVTINGNNIPTVTTTTVNTNNPSDLLTTTTTQTKNDVSSVYITEIGLGVPASSEAVTESETSAAVDVDLIVGIVVLFLVLMAVMFTVVVIVAILLKRHGVKKKGFSQAGKGQSIFNITYDTKGDVNNSLKMEFGGAYDYIAYTETNPSSSNSTGSRAVVHKETVRYHSTGPSASPSDKRSSTTKAGQPGCSSVYSDDVYEAPIGQKFRNIANYYETPQPQDVFDTAGFYVPSMDERTTWEGFHYEIVEIKEYKKLEFFVEDQIYWAPASTTSDLYAQLASKKYREIPRTQLNILQELGSGEFGEVCKAVWSISGATKELAVKTLRPKLPEEEKVRFLQEAAIMGQFFHPNVVKLYGVVTVGDPVMICIELLPNGDLRKYLCYAVPCQQSQLELEKQLLKFSKQIASGMKYLSEKSFVHRDLAARNVLLDESLNCKIADFGMARDLENDTYYTPKTKGGKIPVKWTAPEALLYKKYSTDSDVWSYGMVLFEIWSVGKKPFSQLTNNEAMKLIKSKYNQPPPPGCPRAIYQLMINCWHPVHSKRPRFTDICSYLKSPNEQLLQWSDHDQVASQDWRRLGSPLLEAELLYQDLQNTYKDESH